MREPRLLRLMTAAGRALDARERLSPHTLETTVSFHDIIHGDGRIAGLAMSAPETGLPVILRFKGWPKAEKKALMQNRNLQASYCGLFEGVAVKGTPMPARLRGRMVDRNGRHEFHARFLETT